MFKREATFEWFVLLLWGILLSTQPPAVTSYLNALGLGEGYYHQALRLRPCYRSASLLRSAANANLKNYKGRDRILAKVCNPDSVVGNFTFLRLKWANGE